MLRRFLTTHKNTMEKSGWPQCFFLGGEPMVINSERMAA